MKLHLIVNSSKSYLSYLREEKFREWGVGGQELRSAGSITQANMVNMFGGNKPSKIELQDKVSVDRLFKELESFDATKLTQPIVITTPVPIPSTKKLQSKILEIGGSVDSRNKAEQKSMGTEIFEGLKLQHEVKEFLIDWAGQEPESLIGVIRFLRGLSPEKQGKVSIDIVLMQLAQDRGELSLFDLEGPILKGRTIEAISISRRVPLAPSAHTLYNKLQTLYKTARLIEIEPNIKDSEITDCLNLAGRAVNFIRPTARRIGSEKLKEMVDVILAFDSARKNGAIGVEARFEIVIYKLCEIINR